VAFAAPLLLALAAGNQATAQQVAGPYISLGAGINQQQTLTRDAAPALGLPDSAKWQFNTGFSAEFSVGWGFANGLRLDLEAPYLTAKVSGVTTAGERAGGSEGKYGGMVNVLYDFNLGLPVTPYIGLGAGGLDIEHDGFNRGPTGFTFPGHAGSQSIGDFGYQGIVGLAYPLPFVPGLAMTAEYRFLGALDPQSSFRTNVYNGAGDITATGSTRYSGDFTHSVMLGLRYAFAGPGAATTAVEAGTIPGTAVPLAEPARTYLVFFDWDRADLTARARQIVAEAATASTHVQTTRIDVNGYTDLSGSAEYNKHLSIRRTQSVEAELVRDGVPRDEIAIEGFGEANPLVPTAPDTREPQNRRVAIVLH
jgi:OmpA-OmpF porin, OOP family